MGLKRIIGANMLGAILVAAAVCRAQTPSLPHVSVSPDPVLLFSWRNERCEDWDIPDTPPRVWRDETGLVHLLAGSERNRASVGGDLWSLHHDCTVRLSGSGNPDPSARNDKWWIASVLPGKGNRVEALVHAEYHGHSHPGSCGSSDYLTCWRNAILAAFSSDGGRSFDVDADHPVAMLPYPYSPDQRGRTGYFSPSNMIPADGYVYVYIFAAPYRDQRHGVCLLRRPAGGDATTWRAWDGAQFTIRFVDPYLEPVADPSAHVCTPIPEVRGMLTSVVSRGDEFLAVSPMSGRDAKGNKIDGFWTLTSRDLVHWSAPVLLMKRPLLWHADCASDFSYAYPAFIDPGDADAAFGTVGEEFLISYVRLRLGANCRVGPERDLVAQYVLWPRSQPPTGD